MNFSNLFCNLKTFSKKKNLRITWITYLKELNSLTVFKDKTDGNLRHQSIIRHSDLRFYVAYAGNFEKQFLSQTHLADLSNYIPHSGNSKTSLSVTVMKEKMIRITHNGRAYISVEQKWRINVGKYSIKDTLSVFEFVLFIELNATKNINSVIL